MNVWVYPVPRYDDGLGPDKEDSDNEESVSIYRMTLLLNIYRENRPAYLVDLLEDVLVAGYRALHALEAMAIRALAVKQLTTIPGESTYSEEHLILGDGQSRVIFYVYPTAKKLEFSGQTTEDVRLEDFDETAIKHMAKAIAQSVQLERNSNNALEG
jgi:hypothetical protein